MNQQTLKRAVSYRGPALHTGTVNTVTLRPAPENNGIRFRRVDMENVPEIPADVNHLAGTDRCTTLANGAAQVSTVEHIMAALRGFELDNVYVDLDGPEVPIGDGSAKCFTDLIMQAGLTPLDAPRKSFFLKSPVWVRDGDKTAVALPYDGFKVSFTFTNDHRHPALADLFAEYEVDAKTFAGELAPARTIGWLSEVEALQARGLVKGATMDMAVVLSEDRILTPMRFDDEPVRHKILDVVGDLSLVWGLRAHIICIRSSHALNSRLAQAIAAQQTQAEMS